MRKMYFAITFVLVIICFMSIPLFAQAQSVKDYDSVWYDTRFYPLTVSDIEQQKLTLTESVDILNPPEDLLSSFSTEELTEMLMNYPILWLIISYDFNEIDYFWHFIENSNIYVELLNRDEGIAYLLDYYKNNSVDIERLNNNTTCLCDHSDPIFSEIFCCQFIKKHVSSFDDREYDICKEIINKKTECYKELKQSFLKLYLSFDTTYFLSANNYMGITDYASSLDRGLLSGFTSTGSVVSMSIEGTYIYFTPGYYNKYGVNSNCYKYYSGNYDSSTQTILDNSLWSSWTIDAWSTPKYNCHSYAWIYTGALNEYWMNPPISFTSSSNVIYKGYDITPSNHDILVLYKDSNGAISHSAVVMNPPSGISGIYTISKFGGRPLAEAPLNDVKMYYSSTHYDVYRTY